ncbi:MAG: chromosome segregation protein SMC, partial [Balneolaceae bacterium]|nr:chromosome segregation protein SMC [Balneolaceae bacterium]
MYISELELQGFKSFAYKTKVKFDSGITAIVGPNGCGKSNVVDAMRWVLGEQRPTLLRSSTMTNVIFNGTAQKSALGMAEVSLTFVNNKGLLPTEYNEITITRRLYRSGESEYLINGTTCRLKDIMELFMDTGMGSDAYSVIELKMVEEILNDKHNDRRRLFEEAAGVTRYKEKRKKTFRKLEDTRNDLQRVEDILVEVRKQTRSLELQAEKAQKAREYRKELERLDKALNRYEYEKIQEELKPLEERIKNAEQEKKQITGKAEELEQEEEKARSALIEKERKQSEARRRVEQFNSQIQETETQLRITREKISNEKGVIEQYTKDIEQSEQDLEDLRELFEDSKNKLESFDTDLEKAKQNLEQSREKYREVQRQFNEVKEQLADLEQRYADSNTELGELRGERIRIESRIENTEEEDERIDREIERLEKEIERLGIDKKSHTSELEEALQNRNRQDQLLQEARKERESISGQQEELKDQLRQKKGRLEAVQSEISMLRDIASSNEAFPSSVRYLLENRGDDFELLEVLSDLFKTDEEHAVAVESALDEAMHFVVVESLEDAKRAAGLLKEHGKGRVTFIPLNLLNDTYPVAKESLYHKVDCEERFDPLKQLLLGQVLIFPTIEKARKVIDGTGNTGVTLEGEVITGNRFFQSGSRSKNAGIRVGLEDRISNLEKRAGSLSSEIRKMEKELQTLQKEYEKIDLDQLENKLNERTEVVREIEKRINGIESKIQVYGNNIDELKERREKLKETREKAEAQLDELEPRRKSLKQKIEELKQEQDKTHTRLDALEEERSIVQNRYNEAQLAHQDLQNKVENHEREIRRAETGIQNLKERIEFRTEKREESGQKIEQYRQKQERMEKELEQAREQKREADQMLEEAEETTAKQRGRINEIEKELKEVRRRKEVNMELVHHLAMAKEKFEMQAQNLSDYIWEHYEILMDQIDATMPEDKEPEEVKERTAWLKQKLNSLGEVNPLAIEEYEEEKERLDFYETQIEDLHKAEEELRETIEEINKTAIARFNETFEKIRTNFQQVFHTLFNEDDYCDLVIEEDAEDPLEARIEIKANPRGKRPSTINQLSGGEKTLTAIALLFAIYLVKPSPFCVLDEVDAPLDDANIERFAEMIKNFSDDTQFIIITHNKKTMSKAEMMYGITMPETGISRLVG